MAGQLKDSLIEAMKVLYDDDSKITYDCTVIKCLDGVTGEYELDYMSNKITAYAIDASKKYLPNDLVVVIAPKGDFNDVKYILNLVHPRADEGGGEPDPEKDENTYLRLTDDLLDKDNPEIDIFGLKSYYSDDYNGKKLYHEENITSKVCDITRFKERIVKYLNGKELTYLRLKITIQTSLSQEQIYSNGVYGIKLYIPYINKGYVEYDFNSNNMEGNPKAFTDWTLQSFDIRVNQGYVYNDAMPPIVKVYKDNFIIDEIKVQEPDILIKSVELYAMSILTPEELKGYRVFISATGGDYFIKSDSINEQKTLTATLKSNGIDTDISKDEMYWFIEDPTIDEDDPEYFPISGKGWKCLNPYTIEKVRNDEGVETDKVVFAPRLEKIEIIAKDISGSRKFKCLIKHNGNFFSGETIIYNETDTFFLGLIPTNGEIVSLYDDEVELKLKFYYKGLTENVDNIKKICYTWSKIEKDGSEDFYFTRKYLRVVDKNAVVVEDNKIYWVTTVTFPTSIINELATIKCAVDLLGPVEGLEEFKENKKYYMGTAELKLKLAGEFVDPYLEDLRKAIPSVLYSYNTNVLKVQQNGVVIGSIACKLLRKTDLQGHLVVNLISSDYCNAVVRFLDNEMTELFAPLTFTVQPGRNTIQVPHGYLYRLAGIHSFIVTMQCTNGTITIPVRGVLFSIDGGYLIERLIDIGMDIHDISVKQSIGIDFDEDFIPYEPEEIWTIGATDGKILVKSCKYVIDDVLEWTPRYDMGKGLTAAIEFDGKWYLREDEHIYTLITEKEPFVFVVELDGTLVVYKGGDLATRQVLDTNVSQISVVRGYKSEEYKEQDQGLICAYIKDNLPYYTRYVYDLEIQGFRWLGFNQISTEKALNIYVQRLNDYRVGFLVEFENRNEWYISTRTYVSQAVPKEKIYKDVRNDYVALAVVPLETQFLKGPVVFEDPYKAQDYFYMEYNFPILLRDKHAKELLKDHSIVKINNREISKDTYEIVIDEKKLGIKTKTPVAATKRDDAIIEWSYTPPFSLQLDVGEKHYEIIEKFKQKWIIQRYIEVFRGAFEENAENAIKETSLQITPIQKQHYSLPYTENFKFNFSLSQDSFIETKKLNLIESSCDKEAVSFLFNTVINLELILTGESPI